jgi:hypothetical protein
MHWIMKAAVDRLFTFLLLKERDHAPYSAALRSLKHQQIIV